MTKFAGIFATLLFITTLSYGNRYGVSIGKDVNVRSEAKLYCTSLGKIKAEFTYLDVIDITKEKETITLGDTKITDSWVKINFEEEEGYVFGYFVRTFEYKSEAEKFVNTNKTMRKEYRGEYIYRHSDMQLYTLAINENGGITFETRNDTDRSAGEGRIYIDPVHGEVFFYASMTSIIENENQYLEEFIEEYNREPKSDLEFSQFLGEKTKQWRFDTKFSTREILSRFFPLT